MNEESEVAYCGLFCGDCVIRSGGLDTLANDLLNRMRTPEFQKLAEGLPQLMPEQFGALRHHKACCSMLEAMLNLDCKAICKNDGGSSRCQIRECCRKKNFEGCWLCDQFETCEILSWINPVEKNAHRQNIRIIRENGINRFIQGKKHC